MITAASNPTTVSPTTAEPAAQSPRLIERRDPLLTFPLNPATQALVEDQILRGVVIGILLDGSRTIETLQETFDHEDRLYQTLLTKLSFEALTASIFPGKKEGEAMRAASNDSERETAVKYVCAADPAFVEQAIRRETALRKLQAEKTRYEGAKIVATLLK